MKEEEKKSLTCKYLQKKNTKLFSLFCKEILTVEQSKVFITKYDIYILNISFCQRGGLIVVVIKTFLKLINICQFFSNHVCFMLDL